MIREERRAGWLISACQDQANDLYSPDMKKVHRSKLALAAALFLGVPATRGMADTASQAGDPGADVFFARPDHRVAVTDAALDGFKYRYGECLDAAVTKFLPPRLPERGKPVFDKWGQLMEGAVKESVIVEGCGKQSLENVATISEEGIEKTAAVTPGSTKGDLLLMQETIPYIALYLDTNGMKECANRKVINTRFDDFEGAANPKAKFQIDGGRPYREIWTIDACGTVMDVPVHYVPDQKGIAIHVETK